MPVRLCFRCHGDLPTEATGDLTYCPHCGAPQIFLSEELREQFDQQRLATANPDHNDAEAVSAETVTDPEAVRWPAALQIVALGGGLFALLLLLAFALPSLSVFALLWTLVAPIVLLGAYAARNPRSRVTTRFGARFGLLTGLSIGIAGLVVNALRTLVERFLLRQGPELDQAMTQVFAQVQNQPMQQQLAAQDPANYQQLVALLSVPEYRVGLLLSGGVLVILLYAIYTTVTGAFSGLLRSRSRPAQ